MTGRPGRTAADAGVATLWVAALLVLVLSATLLAVAGATATTSRHAAQLAADLAALAAAGHIGVDDATACAAASRVATANGARLAGCTVTPTGARSGEVRVEVERAATWAGLDMSARARARAARIAGEPAVATRAAAGDVGVRTTGTALAAGRGTVWQHDRRASPGTPPCARHPHGVPHTVATTEFLGGPRGPDAEHCTRAGARRAGGRR